MDLTQTLAALQSQLPQGNFPSMPVPPIPTWPGVSHTAALPPPLSAEDVQAMINASLARVTPSLQNTLPQFEDLFRRALKPEDFAAFLAYSQRGAPGFSELLQSEKLFPIVELLWEEIKGISK